MYKIILVPTSSIKTITEPAREWAAECLAELKARLGDQRIMVETGVVEGRPG